LDEVGGEEEEGRRRRGDLEPANSIVSNARK